MTLLKRFEEKISPLPLTGCWLWNAGVNTAGYGHIRSGRTMVQAHRLSYIFNVGHIPKGMCVLHSCDVRSCVNPKHLFLGSQLDNSRDMISKNRQTWGEKHGSSKLTEVQVIAIRNDIRNLRQIGADYCISAVLVGLIKRKKAWAYL